MNSSAKSLVAASVAGLLVAVGMAAGSRSAEAMTGEGEVSCYGINKCKGTGDCGGKGSSCAGTNACAGQGWLSLKSETCLKIQGGRLTAEPEQAS